MSLVLIMITSQAIQETWIYMGGYGWFNGEWVNNNTLRCFRLGADILLFSEPHAASAKVDFCE